MLPLSAAVKAIAQEKMKLFERIPKDGWLLLPADEPTLDAPVRKMKCPIHRIGDKKDLLSLMPLSLSTEGQVLELSVPRKARAA